MNKLKLEIFFSVVLISVSFIFIIIFIYLILNNYCYIISWEIFNVIRLFVELDVLFDWVSCSFSRLVCLISRSVCIFRVSYISGDVNVKRFIMVLMLFVLSINF